MGLRLIHTEGKNAGAMAKVYRDNDWQEYRVKFYRDGVYEGEASDHHTDDKGDAVATAQLWVKRPRIGNGLVLSEGDERQEMTDAIARTPEDQRQSFFLSLSHEKQALARDILGDTAFDKYVWAPRKGNPEKGPAGSTIQTQAEVNEFVRKMNETVLYAAPLGKTRGIKAWEKNEVFQAVAPPHWDGSPFFRSSDAERIYNMGYRTIRVVGGTGDGFTVELVMQ